MEKAPGEREKDREIDEQNQVFRVNCGGKWIDASQVEGIQVVGQQWYTERRHGQQLIGR